MADLIGSEAPTTIVPDNAEGKLGFLLGRALYLEGMPAGEYRKADTTVEEVTLPTGEAETKG